MGIHNSYLNNDFIAKPSECLSLLNQMKNESTYTNFTLTVDLYIVKRMHTYDKIEKKSHQKDGF